MRKLACFLLFFSLVSFSVPEALAYSYEISSLVSALEEYSGGDTPELWATITNTGSTTIPAYEIEGLFSIIDPNSVSHYAGSGWNGKAIDPGNICIIENTEDPYTLPTDPIVGWYDIKVITGAGKPWRQTSNAFEVPDIGDVTRPDTSITSGPSGTIDYRNPAFTWTGDDDVTSTSNLVYSIKLEGYDVSWSSWTSSTSKTYSDLPNGDYTFEVKARDEAGNIDQSPAERGFTVEAPVLSIAPSSHNFGMVKEGDQPLKTFEIKNIGFGPLRITEIISDQSWLSFNHFENSINVTVNSRDLISEQSGIITVESNGGTIQLIIRVQGPRRINIQFQSEGIPPSYTDPILIMDGQYYTQFDDLSFTLKEWNQHNYTWLSPLTESTEVQYVWTRSEGLDEQNSGSLTVTREGIITAYYETHINVEDVSVSTNSYVSEINVPSDHSIISLSVEGESGSRGFLDVKIPITMLEENDISKDDIIILFDGKIITPTRIRPEGENISISLEYTHSTHLVEIFLNTIKLSIEVIKEIFGVISQGSSEFNVQISTRDEVLSFEGITDTNGITTFTLIPSTYNILAIKNKIRLEDSITLVRDDNIQLSYSDTTMQMVIVAFAGVFLVTILWLVWRRSTLKPPPPPPPYLNIDGYDIGDKIGGGAFSYVYKATRLEDNQIVALKVPKIDVFDTLSSEISQMFVEEAELWKTLKGPNIIQLNRFGVKPFPWLDLEYAEGGNLRSRLKKALILSDVIKIGLSVCEALMEAQAKGVMHRDLKPENILFTSDGQVKVTDWGLGKALFLINSKSGTGMKGTPAYAAPEQVDLTEFGAPDFRTDIYQLGVILYELATGKLPLIAEGIVAMNRKITEVVPHPPSNVVKEIPELFDEIVLKALSKRKEDRFQMAYELKAALLNIHTGDGHQ